MLKKEQLQEYIRTILPEIQEVRRALHTMPELAGNEKQTRAFLKSKTDALQPIYWQPKLGTDLIFEIPGRDPGKVIGLRSDMDGLPITEKSAVSHVSAYPGRMHACGHDGHMSILLAAAMTAKRFQDSLPATVRFIFQPGEEVLCLGAELVDKGACDGLSAVYGFHNWPGLPVGTVSSKPGILFAAANDFTLTVTGRGTHGATPEKGLNPLLPASDAVMRLQGVHQRFSREEGAVISVCSFHAGTSSNVIPAEAVLQGTMRYTSVGTGAAIEGAMQEEIATTAANFGVSAQLGFSRIKYLPVINNEEQTGLLQRTVAYMLGEQAYIPAETHTMGAEDFSFYLNRTPGCMFWLGAGKEQSPIHSDTYDFNDESIEYGVQVLAGLMFADKLFEDR